MATLCAFTAKSIANAIKSLQVKYSKLCLYISGGGYKNPVLLKMLSEYLSEVSIKNAAALGIDPDAKEAILFALLANETVAGKASAFPKHTGAPAVCLGKISFPD